MMSEQCKAAGRFIKFIKDIASNGDWEHGDGEPMTEGAQSVLAMIVPTSTADELPPEGEDILWWSPFGDGGNWRAGYYELGNYPPGFLWSSGVCWNLTNGPTWWMYPPPDPTEGEA